MGTLRLVHAEETFNEIAIGLRGTSPRTIKDEVDFLD